MEKDKRIRQMAESVINNSVELKKGERIYIEAIGPSTIDMLKEMIAAATRAGGIPFYYYNDHGLVTSFFENASEAQVKAHTKIHKKIMEDSDVYVAIRGYDDVFEMSQMSPERNLMYQSIYWHQVHDLTRVPKTRWCVMRYPNQAMAAMSKMSLKDFEDFYFNACLLDYKKMEKVMEPLYQLMKKTDRVKIVAPNTELEFSIKGIGAKKCYGKVNLPDGEVYSAPVKKSINGFVQFNTETTYMGIAFSNVYLEFKNGKIINAKSQINNDKLQDILNIDKGARYMGEFALGLNPHITKPLVDILFDEKIAGSFHMAIGHDYKETANGNVSALHWDLIQMQDPEHGGGEIYFDNVLIRKDGRFVLKELKGLNPEKLK